MRISIEDKRNMMFTITELKTTKLFDIQKLARDVPQFLLVISVANKRNGLDNLTIFKIITMLIFQTRRKGAINLPFASLCLALNTCKKNFF